MPHFSLLIWYELVRIPGWGPGIGFGDLMVSDAARAERLLSRRRVGRSETFLLVLAACALALGAAAWEANLDGTTPLASAALPSNSPTNSYASSFDERFVSAAISGAARGALLQPLDRSAFGALKLKLRSAKERLADQLLSDDWRATLADNEDSAVDGTATQKPEVPLPRSRPAQADLAAQIASSQAFAASAARADNRTFLDRLSDLVPGVKLASLTPDSGLFRRGPDLAALGYDSRTAVYDISARAVYLPSGIALEAHSGMGSLKDNPDHVQKPNVGATPPATYDLKPRERLFHGVRALRMIPTEDSDTLGRVGLLTHSYMLGPNGDSNGCVSIKYYDRFLKAYDNGEINRLVVVPSLSNGASASRRTASNS